MKLAPGIRRFRTGYQVYLRVHGRFYSKVFARDATLKEMKLWREQRRAHAKFGTADPGTGATFADDVQTYLTLIAGMPSFAMMKYRLSRWVEEFGELSRSEIRPVQIRAALERWRKGGNRRNRRGWSPASLNRQRGVLMGLYTTLDGRSVPNPVKDVPPYDESASADILRSHPMGVWYRLLARMCRPLHGPGTKSQPARPEARVMQARLRVMLWTGWPHPLIGALTPQDIDWTHARVRVARRKKGKGTPGRWIPVVPEALAALRQFRDVAAWGAFSSAQLSVVFARAWRHENVWRQRHGRPPLPHMRPLDARHTFNTILAAAVTDDRARELMTMTQQRRYSEGAMEIRMANARDVLSEHLARSETPATVLPHVRRHAR